MTRPQHGVTAGQIIEILSRVPADSPVQLDVAVNSWRRNPSPVGEVQTEQLMADGPPNGLGGPTVVGTGMWVVTIR